MPFDLEAEETPLMGFGGGCRRGGRRRREAKKSLSPPPRREALGKVNKISPEFFFKIKIIIKK